MSYKNPSYEGNPSLDVEKSNAKQRLEIQAKRDQSNQNAVNSVLGQFAKSSANALYPKQNALNKVNKSVLNSKQNLYDKVGSQAYKTNYDVFDAKLLANMTDKIERYGKINMSIQSGLMKDTALGQRELSSIFNEVNTVGKAIPNLTSIASLINKAASAEVGSGERLSVAGAPAYQLDIINKVMANDETSKDLIIYTNNGQTIIEDPNIDRIDKNGEKVKGGILNLNEMNTMIDNGEDPYLKYAVKTTPFTKDAFNNIIKIGEKDDKTFDTQYVNKIDGGKDESGKEIVSYEMTPEQQVLFKNRSIGNLNPSQNRYANGGQFAAILDDKATFESIWEDQMGGKPFGSKAKGIQFNENGLDLKPGIGGPEDIKEYDEFYNTFYLPTLQYLSHVALLNAGSDGIKLLGDPEEEKIKKDNFEKKKLEKWNKTWNALEPGQEMVGLDGLVYEKKSNNFDNTSSGRKGKKLSAELSKNLGTTTGNIAPGKEVKI